MTEKELAAIRAGFAGYKLNAAEHGKFLEIGYYEIAAYQIGRLVEDHVKSVGKVEAFGWLMKVLFVNPGKVAFATAKEAFIHVMAALDALIAVAGEWAAKRVVE